MLKMKILYDDEQELQAVLWGLNAVPMGKSKVRSAEQKGKHKRCYVNFQKTDLDRHVRFRYTGIEQMFAAADDVPDPAS